MSRVQRLKLKDKDVWSFDVTLAEFIAGGLEKLANMAHGYPTTTTPESWDAQLRLHAAAFRRFADEEGVNDPPYRSLLWLAYNFGSLWD